MSFEIWRNWDGTGFLKPQAWEYPLLILCAAALALLVALSRVPLRTWRRRLLFVGTLLAPVVLGRFLVLSPSSGILSGARGLYSAGSLPFVALLGGLPIVVAAWLGPGPAVLSGWVTGLVRAAATSGGLSDSFYLALFGFLLALLLHQEYRGRLASVARQPLAANALAALAAAPLLLLSVFVRPAVHGLAGLADAITWTAASLPALLAESIIAGLVAQAAFALFPGVRLVTAADRLPPYHRSLTHRVLLATGPLLLVLTIGSALAIGASSVRLETGRAIDRMADDATSAALDFAYFLRTGRGLVARFAQDEGLWSDSQSALEDHLGHEQNTAAFFDRLALFTDAGVPIADYPPSPVPAQLTDEEVDLLQRALDTGTVVVSSAHDSGHDGIVFSFLVPAAGADTESSARILLGRTRTETNPILRGLHAILEDSASGRDGFVVDSDGRVVVHSDAALLLTEWLPDPAGVTVESVALGVALDGRSVADNARRLSYHLPVEGQSWSIVMVLPYEAILARAARLVGPLLLAHALVSVAVAVAAPFVARRLVTSMGGRAAPLELAVETNSHQPAGGKHMTSKERQDALAVIAEVGHRIAAVSQPREAIPIVLEAAVEASGSAVARLVFPSREGTPQTVIGRGASVDGVALIDSALGVAATDPEAPIVVEDLSQAKELLDRRAAQGPIRALAALPIHSANVPYAVMWVGYTDIHELDEVEISLLRGLSGQIASLLESSHQLREAQAEGARLAAVLDASGDGVLVTDSENRLLLINTTAEQALGIAASDTVGRDLGEIGLPPPLIKLMLDSSAEGDAPPQGIALPDGRTWRITGSAITGPDGQPMGRTITMRDVTESRQMDETRAAFVGQLSHDLRTPLSLIHGYAAMFPTEGELNERQSLFLKKIMLGASQLEQQLDDLIELGEAEGGRPLELKPCHVGTLVTQSVDSRRPHAAAKGLTLRLDVPEEAAVVSGDASLLRQVVNHLLDNAVQYTPAGGIVTVVLDVQEDQAVIRVSDTGKGIPKKDQARLFEAVPSGGAGEADDKKRLRLGLSVVKSIIQRHGGDVSVDSQVNKGSTFCITLPLSRAGA
ncbi:MAG: PAS domain-containing protein [Anaerolineales bacterium]|nr:MAG: PAS domain-containing protein [Anaerolineales bacterium]